jgi:hydrogenase maturation protein HypF
MPGYRLHIEGQVQGVGFRPYVFRMAKRLGLTGWVNNGNDGVHIHVGGPEDACRVFIEEITMHPPHLARVVRQTVELTEKTKLDSFTIIESDNAAEVNLLLTPDLGLCDECRHEINNDTDRRRDYAFTTCIHCGPRYSIVSTLPYDRVSTSMSDFEMCTVCQKEYNDPENRRHYSQTNSCPQCGVALALHNKQGFVVATNTNEILDQIVEAFLDGKIVAMKGIGGYILMADATNPLAVQLLRDRKHRPSKPFALLYPSIELVEKDTHVSAIEKKEFQSIVSPIVLLPVREKNQSKLAIEQISPGLSKVGVMLPYTPLFELVARRWGKPLVATSGNISGSPIFYDDEKALKNLDGIADLFLVNNRAIVHPQDDSVVQFAGRQRIVLRRSRGLAPTYLPNPFPSTDQTIFAAGSDLKSAFAFLTKGNLYASQFLGDLENFETQESYHHLLDHYLKLFQTRPDTVLVDAHPGYFSSRSAKELAETWQASVVEVQHHRAHFCAVLAENDLLYTTEPVLGVIWDGTGWGDDAQIWGGEFFSYSDNQIQRVAHLDYVDHLLGDKTSREPRLSALSFCKGIDSAEELLKPKFNSAEWKVYYNMLLQSDSLKTSSMGRLFDCVASLLGLCDKSSYEGEAALLLETCAAKAEADEPELRLTTPFSLSSYLKKLIEEIKTGVPKERLAFRFHLALVDWIEQVAIHENTSKLAFSGGVFQNALLNKLIIEKLGERFQLYFHRQLSSNDECIGFGQLAFYQMLSENAELVHEQNLTTETF